MASRLGFYEAFGVLTKKKDNMKFLESKETKISEEDMQFFIDNMQKIFVPAYDGEGFIVWDLKK